MHAARCSGVPRLLYAQAISWIRTHSVVVVAQPQYLPHIGIKNSPMFPDAIRAGKEPPQRGVREQALSPCSIVFCRVAEKRSLANFSKYSRNKLPSAEALTHGARGIHQQHSEKNDQVEHRKHEQATSGAPVGVTTPTHLP